MTGVIASLPKFQFSNALGLPMSGGTLTSYLAGTTTPATTYQDQALATANTNPISLDSRGECTLWLDSTKTYKFVLKNAAGVIQWTVDNIINAQALVDQLRTNLAAPTGSSLVGYMPAGVGAVATTVEQVLHEFVSINRFKNAAAIAGDWTTALQAALNATVTDGVVFGDPRQTYPFAGRVNYSDKELKNIRLTLSGNSAKLVLGGTAKLTKATIDAGSTVRPYTDSLAGVVNLHLATGVEIDKLTIKNGATGGSFGIYCSTLASNTKISNCKLDYISWPILFNDSFGGTSRIVDGVDYTGQSIGNGLYVDRCYLGAADKTAFGDALEINVPAAAFTSIGISRNTVRKTNQYLAEPNGLGLAVANCSDVQFLGNHLTNISHSSGGIHSEGGKNVLISGNMFVSCVMGVGIGIDGSQHTIDGNTFRTCQTATAVTGSVADFTALQITNNQFFDTANYPILLTNTNGVKIDGNTFNNITGGANHYIKLTQTGARTCANVSIRNNHFQYTGGNAAAYPLAVTGTVTEVFTEGNLYSGFSSAQLNSHFAFAKSVGLCRDHVRSSGATSGMHGTTNIGPTGYITGTLGDFMTDVNAGVLYRHDGTNWVSKIS